MDASAVPDAVGSAHVRLTHRSHHPLTDGAVLSKLFHDLFGAVRPPRTRESSLSQGRLPAPVPPVEQS
jgi:hypothetical protein